MSTTFVTSLRASRPPIVLSTAATGSLTLRVEASDLWEAIRVVADPDTTVAEVKQSVALEFYPNQGFLDELVLKLRGWEVLDESQPLAKAGVVDGSILLLAHRRRRPVR